MAHSKNTSHDLEKYLDQANRDARAADRKRADQHHQGSAPNSRVPSQERIQPVRRKIEYKRSKTRRLTGDDNSKMSSSEAETEVEVVEEIRVPAPAGKRPRRDLSSQNQTKENGQPRNDDAAAEDEEEHAATEVF